MNKLLTIFCLVLFVFPVLGQDIKKLPDDQESPYILKIRTKLETMKINLNFSEAPLKDVIQYIQTVSEINIVIDPGLERRMTAEGTKVTLNVDNIQLKSAFNILLVLYNLDYCFRDDVLFIPGGDSPLPPENPKLVIYDIKHFSSVSPDFSSPSWHLPGGVFLPAFPAGKKATISISGLIKSYMKREITMYGRRDIPLKKRYFLQVTC